MNASSKYMSSQSCFARAIVSPLKDRIRAEKGCLRLQSGAIWYTWRMPEAKDHLEDIGSAVDNLCHEVKALADILDEIRDDFGHALQNDKFRPKVRLRVYHPLDERPTHQ